MYVGKNPNPKPTGFFPIGIEVGSKVMILFLFIGHILKLKQDLLIVKTDYHGAFQKKIQCILRKQTSQLRNREIKKSNFNNRGPFGLK